MQCELERLQTVKQQSKQPVLRLGPTTDDASSSIKVKGSAAYIETNLSNGKKGSITIPLADLLNIYSKVITQLEVTTSA